MDNNTRPQEPKKFHIDISGIITIVVVLLGIVIILCTTSGLKAVVFDIWNFISPILVILGFKDILFALFERIMRSEFSTGIKILVCMLLAMHLMVLLPRSEDLVTFIIAHRSQIAIIVLLYRWYKYKSFARAVSSIPKEFLTLPIKISKMFVRKKQVEPSNK